MLQQVCLARSGKKAEWQRKQIRMPPIIIFTAIAVL